MKQDETITVKELAEALQVTRQAIMKKAKKEHWPYENGKNKTKRFLVNKLPESVRMALTESQTNEILPTLYKGIAKTMPNPLTPALSRNGRGSYLDGLSRNGRGDMVPVGSPDLADWQNRIALARADLIRAYLAEKQQAKSQRQSVKAGELYIKGYNTGQLLPKVFDIIGPTAKQTVEAWVKVFRDSSYDYTALAPKWGNRAGDTKVTDNEFNVALSFALHPNRLRISEVTRLTKIALKKRSIDSPSHEATIRRTLKNWIKTHYDQWIFCREGEKALNDKCLPYLERDIGLLEVGEVLVADGHTLNFQILHPFTGKPCRMIMVMWYDWASCMPVGWEIMPTESVQCVAAGMRRAIITIGKMPRLAYLDNGKAFRAKTFTSKDIDFEEAGFYGMFARLGIETIFAWPYNAQSKPVERFFSTFNELERLMPTYTGASIEDKPAHLLRNEKLHKQLHEKKYGGWVPTVDEANQIIAGWINEYAARPHQGLKGLCPGELLKSGRGPGVDKKALRFLMMSMEIKKVHRNGIRFMGRNYYDEALYGYEDRAMIRYDLEDLSSIYVCDKTGSKEICEARPVRPVHPVAKLTGRKEDMALVTAGIKQKRALKRGTERVARGYIEDAPRLILVPEHPAQGAGRKAQEKKPMVLPRAEAERIEAEAARMTVLELKPKEPDPVYMSEADRYEALLERESKEQEMSLDEMTFMRYFETTRLYTQLKDRFDFLRELWIAGPEEEEDSI